MKRKTVPQVPELPQSHLIALSKAGFTVIAYLNESIRVQCESGERSEWLPRLCISGSGKDYRIIEWLPVGHPANNYGFSGWTPQTVHTSGSMCETIGQALGWFTWVEEQKAKRA